MTRFYPSTSIVSTGLLLLALSASAVQPPTCEELGIDLNQDSCREYCSNLGYDGVTTPGSSLVFSTSTSSCICNTNDNTLETVCQSAITETSPSSTSPMYNPKSTCESMGITNIDECVANCDKYFPVVRKNDEFGPYGPNNEPLHPQFCKCNGVVDIVPFVEGEDDRYICGATTDVYFTCSDVNVTDAFTCDDACKQDTSTPGTTFHGGWYEEHQMCDCMADVPNSGEFNYCGGPPPPPAGGVLPTCKSLRIYEKDDCESYCRDYASTDYPQIEDYYDPTYFVDGGMSCLCSTGSGCKDPSSPPTSSSNALVYSLAALVGVHTIACVAGMW